MSSDRALALVVCAGCAGQAPPTALHGSYPDVAPAALSCLPNLDGRIDASELPIALGVPETFLVSPPGTTRSVDVVGQADDAGQRVWDWSVDYADDKLATLAASALTGKWYASSFPNGQFVLPFDAADQNEAIYSEDATAVWLWGLASSQQNPSSGQTLLPYANGVPVYEFPLQEGSSWNATGEVQNGTLEGLPYNGVDAYQFDVEDQGILELPELTFTQAMALHITLTTTPAVGAPLTTREVSFVFECYGEVARATSLPNETQDDFTTAAEVRRLSLEQE
ncbi:MAG TPA: hypothetical protein VMB50_21145 [Myxococcales bacterium]|nr:hypothetical protein [Myxococcales bacterium]